MGRENEATANFIRETSVFSETKQRRFRGWNRREEEAWSWPRKEGNVVTRLSSNENVLW